jgi:hypothetical protein
MKHLDRQFTRFDGLAEGMSHGEDRDICALNQENDSILTTTFSKQDLPDIPVRTDFLRNPTLGVGVFKKLRPTASESAAVKSR